MASTKERPRLSVMCCTANIGNTYFDNLRQWIPRNGIATGNGEQIDVIAVAMQESVFPMSSEDSQSIVLLDEEVLVAFDKTSQGSRRPSAISTRTSSTTSGRRKHSEIQGPMVNPGFTGGDDVGSHRTSQCSRSSTGDFLLNTEFEDGSRHRQSGGDVPGLHGSPKPVISSRKNSSVLLSGTLDTQVFGTDFADEVFVDGMGSPDGVNVLSPLSSDSSSSSDDDDDDADNTPAAESAWRSLVLDKIDAKCSTHILHVVTQHLGPGYTLVQSVRKWQMRLLVFHHTGVSVPKESVEWSWKNTGVGVGVRLANKGGQVVSFDVIKGPTRTSLCFVSDCLTPRVLNSCHLTAHEGGKYLKCRNRSVRDIMEYVEIRKRQVDFSARHPYTFWMGDMNYRCCGRREQLLHVRIRTHTDNDHDDQWQAVHELIGTAQSGSRVEQDAAYQQLWVADELMDKSDGLADPDTPHVTLRGEVLYGWRTMKPRFPPTFKVTRHTPEHVYEQKRIPSYCDRVLWSALSGFLPRVTVREYTSDPTFDTSDHKPVKCLFDLSPMLDFAGLENDMAKRNQAGGLSDSECIRIVFSQLACENIERDKPMADAMNPYIKIYSHPPDLLSKHKVVKKERTVIGQLAHGIKAGVKAVKAVAVGQSRAPCTHTLRNTVNPVWNDDTVFATVHVAPDGPEHVLDDCHVIVTCMDEEAVTSDICIGHVSVCVGDVLRACKNGGPYVLDDTMTHNGRPTGRIKGELHLWHPTLGVEYAGDYQDIVGATQVAKVGSHGVV